MSRVGVDVGGTNTDAALLVGDAVVTTAKTPSSPDIVSGMVAGLQLLQDTASFGLEGLSAVMVGTTQFVNAVIERKHLARVFVVRLCGSATAALPPFLRMPAPLVRQISAGYCLAPGGYEYDGATEISHTTEADVAEIAGRIMASGAEAVVVCGVHAPINPSQELAVGRQLQQLLPQTPGSPIHITLSHQLSGRLGLLEREAAAVLNAALQPLAARVIPGYSAALQQLGLGDVPLYLTGNDGSLLSAAEAQRHPVLTFKSGPVNSLRGAAYLAGLRHALVMDIGGTTTDVGAVVQGLPRMAGSCVDIAGVRTNFRMPDVVSFGVGGGSLVCWQPPAEGTCDQGALECSIGPSSVGAAVTSASLVCGGTTCTASDVAVLLHDRLPELASQPAAAARVAPNLLPTQQQLGVAWDTLQARLAAAVDAAKASAQQVPLVVVGGGAGLCGDHLPGVTTILRPKHAEVANAVGAAIPQVAGTCDTLVRLQPTTRQQQLEAATQQATAAAVAAGAEPTSCEVVEQEVLPVAYGPPGSTRLYVKVVGRLQLTPGGSAATAGPPAGAAAAATSTTALAAAAGPAATSAATEEELNAPLVATQPATIATPAPPATAAADTHKTEQQRAQHGVPNLEAYIPVVDANRRWQVSDLDLDLIAIGTQILGAGGGGSAWHNRLKLQHAMTSASASGAGAVDMAALMKPNSTELAASQDLLTSVTSSTTTASTSNNSSASRRRPVIISLRDLPDSAYACDVGGMGAPTVSAEKLDSNEGSAAVKALSQVLPNPITAVLCAEVGGGNALEPVAVGLQLGLPVVDADLMGRAFPELQMNTAAIAGVPLTPAAIADDKGNVLVMTQSASAAWAERALRAACDAMGCSVGLASTPMEGRRAKQVMVPGSLSLAWSLGRALLAAQAAKADPVAALLGVYQGSGRQLFCGKVVDVQRSTQEGFVRGSMHISSATPMPLLGQTENGSSVAHGAGQARGSGSSSMDAQICIEFQNENVVAKTAAGQVLACVPDLICVLDAATGEAVATEELRYGLQVSVVALPAHPMLRTAAALEVVGPAAFGYSGVTYEPVGAWPQQMHTVHELHG